MSTYRNNDYPDARTGWVWGWLGRQAVWLSVPGSACTRPDLAGHAPAATPPPAELAAELALCQVAEVWHPGVTGPRGMAYRVIDHPPAEVAALAVDMGRLTERQVAELAEVCEHPGPHPGWAEASGGWAAAAATGRAADWYRCRHAVEGWEPYGRRWGRLGYHLGYLAAAVACRDLLTAEAYAALTGWAAPHLAVPDHTAPAPDRTPATP